VQVVFRVQVAHTMAAMPTGDRSTDSALGSALDRVGDRWSLLVVDALLLAPRRFNDLADAVAGIAPNTLADRLRRLERDGVVVATAYSQRPPRMEYSLTADGRELAGALRLLADWGARRGPAGSDDHEPLRHSSCGTPLEARWYCPTCSTAVRDADAAETRQV
jgi:DNA-binding HxlR family transcriptional regulator